MNAGVRYGFAVAATACAIAATVHYAELLAPMRLLFLWAAVLLTAVVCGTGPALLATAGSIAGAVYAVFPPAESFRVEGRQDLVRLLLFASFATVLSIAVGSRRAAEERARRLSASLRESEVRYRTLVESNPSRQAIWTATPEGRVRWSPVWAEITGQPLAEIESGGAMKAIHPEDAARTWSRWTHALATGDVYEDAVRVRVAGGRDRWFAMKASPVRDGEGRIVEWVGIVADIHDRKHHEEAAAFINRASEILTATLDSEAAMRNLARLCVPALGDWCAIHLAREGGYERIVAEHTDPARIALIARLDDAARRDPGNDEIIRVLETGTARLVEEFPEEAQPAADPEQRELMRELGFRSWIVAPMKTRGRTLGTLTLVQGESGRRYAAEDLPLVEELARRAAMALENSRLYEAAESANRAKDEFLATLSHELRTPLTAIAGWAHILQAGPHDDQTAKLAVETIVRSAKTQGELIDDLLDVARVMAGTLRLDVSTVDLAKVAREVTVAARPASEAKRLALELDASAAVLVRGDERRLRQIVWNLLTNAIKFSGEGGFVRVSVGSAAGLARVVVSDAGCGIDPAFLPFVWDRFRQADSSASRRFGGLGLGLSLVRYLVELHGGTAHAGSEGLNRGAEFRVEIPLARAAVEPPRAAGEGLPVSAAGRRILVVDDDADARAVISAMLERLGAAVAVSASAAEATLLLGEETYDLVLSDIAMPGEDGYAFARRLGAPHEVPMIAVSAIGSEADRSRALEAGFVDFVRKPVDAAALSRALQAAFRPR